MNPFKRKQQPNVAEQLAAYRASKPEIFPGVRELKRAAIEPIHVIPGDTIQLSYRETDNATGKVVTDRVVLAEPITKAGYYTEAVIFESDAGIFGAGAALGGAFIEEKK